MSDEMKEFSVQYIMDGKLYAESIMAFDFADAEKRAAAMMEGIQVQGEIYGRIESTPEEEERIRKWQKEQRDRRDIG
ncbi:MAG: hypothetical protein LRY54_04155 [Alphaproteobacteria bacterium]|nr:hypothetical protein [Alphaproteobacteria bacterium]